ncbi:MAG TPA: response regulator transcription factor [Gemmatimonas sp.]|nr:response regulator transcription factor [Gemmatimonas sp.]
MNHRSDGTGGAPGPSTNAADAPVITVAVIEDNRLLREGLTILLNKLAGIRVIGGGASADTVLFREKREPRIVLLDLGLRAGDSLRVARRVKREFPQARIVIMDLLPAHEEVVEFVHAGVSGFLLKDATIDDLERTIRSVADGVDVLPPQLIGTLFTQIARDAVARGLPPSVGDVKMTPRERQVILLIAEGLSNKEIGARLHIATHTVKSHVRNVMEKLTLRTRLQIAAYVRENDR